MRLREIEVENYGLFRGTKLGFGDGRFHLVCGPNEAGKSTLLQLIRELLFGFVVRGNPYAFPEHDGEMAATASAEMKDGTRIRFRRRKGQKNTVSGQIEGSDRTFDQDGLTRLLGNANPELYQNVFGFSLAELASGEESLKHAKLEEALFGGGLGGLANFQRALTAIQEEHQSLFMASRRAQRPINKLFAAIHEAAANLNKKVVKPRDYKDLCQHRDESLAAADKARADRDACFRRVSHIDRLRQALPAWQRLAQARQEFAPLQVSESFPLADAEEFRRLREQRTHANDDVATLTAELDECDAALGRLHLSPELVAAEGDIKKLFQQLEQIASCRRDIPARTQEAESSRAEIVAQLGALHPDWDLSHLEAFRTSLAQRDRVDQMAAELAVLEKQAASTSLRHQEKEKSLAQDRRELAELQAAPSSPGLESLTRRAVSYRSDQAQHEQLDAELAQLDAQLAPLRRQLAGPSGVDVAAIESLPVPLVSAVQEFARLFSEANEAVRQADRDRQQAERNAAQARAELQQHDVRHRVPDRKALVDQRSRRDEGWRLLRRMYIEGQSAENDAAAWLGDASASLPDQYEHEVSQADRLADDRQEKAEWVARREQIAADVAGLDRHVAESQQRVADCERARDRLKESWRQLWLPCGLSPQSPDTMAEWLRLHGQLRELLEKRLSLDTRRQQIQRRLSAFEEDLKNAIGGDRLPDEALVEAEHRVQEARDAAKQRERLERDLPGRQREVEELADASREMAVRRTQWGECWQSLMVEIGFPPEWESGLVSKILSELANARVRYQSVQGLDARVAEMAATVADFERRVTEWCKRLAPDLEPLPAEVATAQLNRRLEEAKESLGQQKSFLAQRDRAAERLKAKRDHCERLKTRLAELRRAAAVESDEEFDQLARDAAKQKALTEEIENLRRQIDAVARNEEPDTFLAELEQADVDAIALAARETRENLAGLEEAYRNAVGEAALAKKQVEDLDAEGQVNALAQKLESDRAELRDTVERWAPLVFADAILAQAIARFEREHQPELLRDVGRLFGELTQGRYVGLRRRLDEQGTLVLAQSDGKDKEPQQLSTGTREQLYLAIRLAYARHYCRENEPLPLVMDDVLVNCDDRRSDAALDMLLEVAKDIQLIFLTCHEETMRRIQSRLPQLEPTRLG